MPVHPCHTLSQFAVDSQQKHEGRLLKEGTVQHPQHVSCLECLLSMLSTHSAVV